MCTLTFDKIRMCLCPPGVIFLMLMKKCCIVKFSNMLLSRTSILFAISLLVFHKRKQGKFTKNMLKESVTNRDSSRCSRSRAEANLRSEIDYKILWIDLVLRNKLEELCSHFMCK